jgi:hypothetical protein
MLLLCQHNIRKDCVLLRKKGEILINVINVVNQHNFQINFFNSGVRLNHN